MRYSTIDVKPKLGTTSLPVLPPVRIADDSTQMETAENFASFDQTHHGEQGQNTARSLTKPDNFIKHSTEFRTGKRSFKEGSHVQKPMVPNSYHIRNSLNIGSFYAKSPNAQPTTSTAAETFNSFKIVPNPIPEKNLIDHY